MLIEESPIPKYIQLKQILKNKILQDNLEPHFRLPSERDIVKKYGLNLITVREALSRMEQEGLIYRKHGSGTFVSDIKNMKDDKKEIGRHTIGLMVTHISNPYFAELTSAVQNHARKAGVHIIVAQHEDVKMDEELRHLGELGVRVVIIGPVGSQRVLEGASAGVSPSLCLVCFGCRSQLVNTNFLAVDMARGIFSAVRHLYTLGRRNIALVSSVGMEDGRWSKLEGYWHGCQEMGLSEILIPLINEHREKWEGGKQLVDRILKESSRPDAIIGYNDVTTLGLVSGLRQQGVRVPDDIAVIGVDGISRAEDGEVPLTTVSQRITDQARELVDMAIAISKEVSCYHTRQMVLEPELIIRESCGANLTRKGGAKKNGVLEGSNDD